MTTLSVGRPVTQPAQDLAKNDQQRSCRMHMCRGSPQPQSHALYRLLHQILILQVQLDAHDSHHYQTQMGKISGMKFINIRPYQIIMGYSSSEKIESTLSRTYTRNRVAKFLKPEGNDCLVFRHNKQERST